MNERRTSTRTRCRLGCLVYRGQDRIRTRVLDVSENGLCVVSPVELEKGQTLEIVIDVPNHGNARVTADVWHLRRVKNKTTGKRVWAAGMMIVKSDEAYARLLGFDAQNESADGAEDNERDDISVFRVRVKLHGQSRTRLLTLAADSEEEARRLALDDLDAKWTVIEVLSVSDAA